MVTTPHTPSPAPPAPPPSSSPPSSSVPGGLASDPFAALANQLVTTIKGVAVRSQNPQLLEQMYSNTTAEVAQTIKSFIDQEVAKVTGGLVPK